MMDHRGSASGMNAKADSRPRWAELSAAVAEAAWVVADSLSSCLEKARIFEELTATMAAIIALNNREMEAVIAGKTTDQFAIELRYARDRKVSLLSGYAKHVRAHGC